MTAAKHTPMFTPGPWTWATYSKKRFGIGQRGEGAFFLCHCMNDDTSSPYAQADMRLMAAAPDLLGLLQMAQSGALNASPVAHAQWLLLVDAAIAKATGSAE